MVFVAKTHLMIAFFDMLMKAFAPITNFFNQMTEFCIHLLQVLRAKMSIAHEKELHINQKNVYPTVKKLPTPLCCFKIMHIRTGTLWIAYCEIMWIVSQCSFWTAESIVRKAFPPVVIMTGFAFTCLQLVLVFFLIQGVKKFRLAYIEVYMIGVCCRMFLFLSLFLSFLFFFIITDSEERANSQQFFHRFLIGKLIFTGVYTCLKGFALYTAYRCYSYIAKTRRAVGHLTIFEEPNMLPFGLIFVRPRMVRFSSNGSVFQHLRIFLGRFPSQELTKIMSGFERYTTSHPRTQKTVIRSTFGN